MATSNGGSTAAAREPLLHDQEAQGSAPELVHASWADLAKNFSVMGWLAFGGPTAHLGFFQKAFVEKLRWFSHSIFLELLALCQCMPGPTSTQVSFALGTFKQGTFGGLMTGLLFNYPGAVVMTLLGIGLGDFIVNAPDGGMTKCVIAGLSAVGVALVACACVGLCKGACKDKVTTTLCTLAAAATIFSSSVYLLPLMLVIGALTTLSFKWKEDIPPKEEIDNVNYGLSPLGGGLLFAVYFLLLGAAFFVESQSFIAYEDMPILFWAASFYRVGALIFGGGQVRSRPKGFPPPPPQTPFCVPQWPCRPANYFDRQFKSRLLMVMIPLLIDVVVQQHEVCHKLPDGTEACKIQDSPGTWVTTDQFYAGLAAAQSMPGPLFNFSTYLGAVMAGRAGVSKVVGALVCWLGMFGPGIMLIFALLPFWGQFRNFSIYKKMMPGLNSSAVGLVVSALFKMLLQVHGVSPVPSASLAIGILGYTAVMVFHLEAPLAVIAGGCLGAIAFYAKQFGIK